MLTNTNTVEQPALTQPSSEIRLRGLAYDAKEKELEAFFKGYEIVDTHIREKHGWRPNAGTAHVKFISSAEAQRALSELHMKYLGDRYIELAPAEEGELERRRKEDSQNALYNSLWVRLVGLPFQVQAHDVIMWLGQPRVRGGTGGVLLVYHPSGQPTGHAFIQLETTKDKEQVLQKHMCRWGNRYIEILQSSHFQVEKAQKKYKVVSGAVDGGLFPVDSASGFMEEQGSSSVAGRILQYNMARQAPSLANLAHPSAAATPQLGNFFANQQKPVDVPLLLSLLQAPQVPAAVPPNDMVGSINGRMPTNGLPDAPLMPGLSEWVDQLSPVERERFLQGYQLGLTMSSMSAPASNPAPDRGSLLDGLYGIAGQANQLGSFMPPGAGALNRAAVPVNLVPMPVDAVPLPRTHPIVNLP